MKLAYIRLFFVFQTGAIAFGQSLIVKKGEILKLPDAAATAYNQYLGERRDHILQQLPGLRLRSIKRVLCKNAHYSHS